MDDPASIQKFLAAMSRGPNLQTNKYTSHTTEPQNSSNEVAEEKSIVTQPSKESSVTEPSKADPHNNVMGGKHSPALTEDAVAPVAEVPKDKTTVPEAPNAKAGDNDTENTTHTKSSSVEPLKEVTAINKPEAKTSPKAGHVDWYKDLKDRMDVIRKSQGPMDPRLTQNYSPIPPEYEERCIVARDTIQKVLESYSPRSSRPSSSHGSQGQGSVIQGFTRTRTFASKTPSPKNTRGPSEQSRMAGTKDSRAGSPLSQRGDNWVAPHLRNLKKDHRAEDTTKVAPEQSANVETNTPNQEKTWFPRHLPSPDHSDRGDSRSRPTTEETSPSPLQLSQEKPESAQDDGPASHSPTMTPCPQSLKHSSPAKDESNEPPSKEVPTVPAPESIEAQKSTQQAVASIVVTPKAVGEHVDREGVLYFKSWGAPQQRERAAARIRKVHLTTFPPFDNPSPRLIASLTWGGPLEQILCSTTSASVTFLSPDDCQKYYVATANGIPFGSPSNPHIATVRLAAEPDVIGGRLQTLINKEATRCVRAVGELLDDERNLEPLARGKMTRERKVEKIIRGKNLRGVDTVTWRFCDIRDAEGMMNELRRNEDWEHCNIHYAPDPCAEAKSVHSD